MNLYNSLEKIDAHMHYNRARPALLEEAETENFRFLSINTEVPFFPSLSDQEKVVMEMQENNQSRIDFVTSFSTETWGSKGWQDRAIEQIKSGLSQGAVGVKFWKNIGMTLRDDDGTFVMVDDPSFDPIFHFCEKEGVPVLGHLGEPKNCWLPVEEMTVKGDREYFAEHPEYHMYKHPEYPSYNEQLEARDRRLAKHPGLRFIGAHLASLEWSVDKQAGWLDRFPNAAMDMAERICHLQYQAVENPNKVRSFLIKYQDRLLYGTDVIDDGSHSDSQIREHINSLWKEHWSFFRSDKKMSSTDVTEPFKGMALPDGVIAKIYRDNALNWYPSLTY